MYACSRSTHNQTFRQTQYNAINTVTNIPFFYITVKDSNKWPENITTKQYYNRCFKETEYSVSCVSIFVIIYFFFIIWTYFLLCVQKECPNNKKEIHFIFTMKTSFIIMWFLSCENIRQLLLRHLLKYVCSYHTLSPFYNESALFIKKIGKWTNWKKV